MSSLNELITSRIVTINVGPEQSKVNMSTSLFQGISEPLHRLLNSVAVAKGDISEINNCLQYDDEDAFLQLVSTAYNTILNNKQAAQLGPVQSGDGESDSRKMLELDSTVPQTVRCRDCVKGNLWLDVKCDSPKSMCKAPRLNKDYGLQFFFELSYLQSYNVAACILSKQATLVPDPINPVTAKPYPLIHFARVFNLAVKWRVDGLQHTSFLGFQNRLKRYVKAGPDEKAIEELLDAFRYLASTASTNAAVLAVSEEKENIDIEQSVGVPVLLKTLMRYFCVHIPALIRDMEFRRIVAEYGITGLVLFEIVDETIVASRGDE